MIPQNEVYCFVSEEGLTRLHTSDQSHWIDPTLNNLEIRLDSTVFLRISRASMVRLEAVREVIPMMGGSGEVLLKNGIQLEVSRRRFRELLEALKG